MFQEQALEKATTVWAPCATQTAGGCRPQRAVTGQWREGEDHHSGRCPRLQHMPSCVFHFYSDLTKTWSGTPCGEDQRFLKQTVLFQITQNPNTEKVHFFEVGRTSLSSWTITKIL